MRVIAELCQNHGGDVELLEEMVHAAERAGVWAVKVQSFFADDLAPDWKGDYARLKRAELSWELQARFVQWCDKLGVTPMTSVYSAKYAGELQACGFKHIKIGSAQCDDDDLIAKYSTLGFQVTISTGGHRIDEVSEAGPLHALLHCVSLYPTALHQANLARMLELKARRSRQAEYFGFSDHTQGVEAAHLARFLGADLLEKHFTLKPKDRTKDGPVSADFDELKAICTAGGEDPAWGVFKCEQAETEMALIDKYKGRWK
ncbi:MAG: hypothetical protein GY701_19225 [Sulfitobacter sp.]|nr:hypothetical protein [Sulfitobacter sp.]